MQDPKHQTLTMFTYFQKKKEVRYTNFQCKSLQQQIPMPIQLADNQVSDSMRNICFSCLRVVPKLFTAVI